MWVAVVIVIAGVVAGWFFGLKPHTHVQTQTQPRPPASTAQRPVVPAVVSALKIPEEVPTLSLPDGHGTLRALRDGTGQPHLYNFWATWCEPCRREIPLLNTLQHTYRADHLTVVGIAVDFADAVRDFVKTTPLRYASLIGEEAGLEAAQKFGMDVGLPFSVFADEHDRIIALKVGELHREEAEAILAQMRLLKADRITLSTARATIGATLQELAAKRAKQSKPV